MFDANAAVQLVILNLQLVKTNENTHKLEIPTPQLELVFSTSSQVPSAIYGLTSKYSVRNKQST